MNHGWTYAIDRLLTLNNIESADCCSDAELDAVRRLSRKPLSVSLALVQQGVELLLKGRIAEVSPFLLIKDQPRQWPSRCTERDVAFAEFRTIDSQELMRAYETVRQESLSEGFREFFEKLRLHRNKAFHTVDANLEIRSREVLMAVLEAANNLLGTGSWFLAHREFLENSPEYAIDDYFLSIRIMHEMELLEDMLGASDMCRFVGYDAAKLMYPCPACRRAASKAGGKNSYAQSSSADGQPPGSLYCFCCCRVVEAIHFQCQSADCESTFLTEDGDCLLCGTMYDVEDIATSVEAVDA